MTETGNQRVWNISTTVLQRVWCVLAVIMSVPIIWKPGWGELPVSDLPLAFWLLYVPLAVVSFMLIVVDQIRSLLSAKDNSISIVTAVISVFLLAIALVGVNQILSARILTGVNLLTLLIAGLISLLAAGSLLLTCWVKLRRSA